MKIRFYNDVWKVEKTLEHINGVRIQSVNLTSAIMFSGILVVEYILVQLCSFLKAIPNGIIVALIIPFVITALVNKVKLDGRSSIQYLVSRINYARSTKEFVGIRPATKDAIYSIKYRVNFNIHVEPAEETKKVETNNDKEK